MWREPASFPRLSRNFKRHDVMRAGVPAALLTALATTSRSPLTFTLQSFAAFVALVLASPGPSVFAQDAGQQAASIFTVIVTRHGVREISAPSNPGYFWPDWRDEPYLTGHGYRLMRLMGEFYQESLPVADCSKNVFIYADKSQRTLATARALLEGLCHSSKLPDIYHEPDVTAKDPIFDATDWLSKKPGGIDSSASEEAVAAAAGCPQNPITNCLDRPVKQEEKLFEAFQGLLATRCKSGACEPIVSAKKSSIKGGEKQLASLDGPVGIARSYSEDVFLEFAQCRPESQMTGQNPKIPGLNREQLLSALEAGMRLHVVDYDINARNTYVNEDQRKVYNPKVRGGTLLAHIIAMLDQKAGKDIFKDIKTPNLQDATLAILSGHDTQLAALGGILDAHWEPEGGIVKDDMPPGSALVFDLMRAPDGKYRVRIRFASMTRDQFRYEKRLSEGIKFHPVHYALCQGDKCCTTDGCGVRLEQFEELGRSLKAQNVVDPDWSESHDQAPVQEAVAKLSDPSWTETECRGP